MTYIYENHNTKAYYSMAWISLVISALGIAAGLVYLDANFAMKGFLAMSYLFSIASCFTVAKVVRDKYEAEKFTQKVEHAKTEQFLNENAKV